MNNYLVFTIILDEELREILIAELAEIGFEGFMEQENGIEAYLPEADFDQEGFDSILNRYGIAPNQVTKKHQEPENWNAKWESDFQPVTIENKLIVRAPFHEPSGDYELELIIQPKTSFGTGHHETTRTILGLMIESNWKEKSVFDFGAGTGILAILAKKLGAGYVFANDIDDWAAENILENLALNHCDEIDFKKGGLEVCPEKSFDCILANINKNVLMGSFDKLSSVSHAKTELFISGFFETDLPDLLINAEAAGWKLSGKRVENGWCAAILQKA